MKKFNPWLILLLSIVTFGIYPLIWHILRRAEMVEKYKQPIPHWIWMIAPAFVMFLWAVLALIAIVQENEKQLLFSVVGLVVCGAVAVTIAIWWMWQFAKAAARVTGGKIPAGWTLALYLLTGLHIYFLQYYFNRAGSPKEVAAEKHADKPSQKFIVLAVTAIVVTNVGGFVAGAFMPTFEDPEEQRLSKRIDNLTERYERCTDKLNADFYEVTVENETAYDAAYRNCENIGLQLDRAIDKYDDYMGW